MQEYIFHYSFDPIPPIMKRGRHALIVVKDNDGRYILGAKEMCPEGIYRLVGGGIKSEENILDGAVREIDEELQISVDKDNLKPLAKLTVHIKNSRENVVFETYLFFLEVGDKQLTPSDDLSGLVRLTKEEVLQLVERYHKLSDEIVDFGADKKGSQRWSDYGKFYGEVHKIAMQLT